MPDPIILDFCNINQVQSVKQINADREGKIKSAPTLMHMKSANVPEWSVSTFKPSFWPANINDKVRGKSARLHAARALS